MEPPGLPRPSAADSSGGPNLASLLEAMARMGVRNPGEHVEETLARHQSLDGPEPSSTAPDFPCEGGWPFETSVLESELSLDALREFSHVKSTDSLPTPDMQEVQASASRALANAPPGQLDSNDVTIYELIAAGDLPGMERYICGTMSYRGEVPKKEVLEQAVDACLKTGDIDRALSVLLWAVSHKVQPGATTCGPVCKALAAQGRPADIQQLAHTMETCGFKVGETIFASLVYACGAVQPPDLQRAERAFYDMVARGLKPQKTERVFRYVFGNRRTKQLFSSLAPAPQSEVVETPAFPPRHSQAPEQLPSFAYGAAGSHDPGFVGSHAPADARYYVPGATLMNTAAFPPMDTNR